MKIILEPKLSKYIMQNICVARGCMKSSPQGTRFCFKHKREWQKINNPLRYWFDVLRQNAKRRSKNFELTIDDFKDFCNETDYIALKGRKNAGNYTIDRRNDKLGYIKGNIYILTLGQNSRKRWIDLKLEHGGYPTEAEMEELYGGQEYFDTHIKPSYEESESSEDDVPF